MQGKEEKEITKSGAYGRLAAILILAVFAALIVFDLLSVIGIQKVFPYKLGLDLQGGVHLVYEGDLAGLSPEDKKDAMASVRDVIERRVNAFGVAEPVVQISGESRLIVELAGVKDVDDAIREIGLTPFLEFRIENPGFKRLEDEAVDLNERFSPTGLSGKHLKKSDIVFDPQSNQPQITLQFNKEGEELFAQITRENIGRPVAIFLDEQIISAPIVQQEIKSGQAVITGNFTIEDAKELAGRLNAGALPVPIKLIQQQSIGATLGNSSIQKSLTAGLIGLLAVAVFMIVYYRLFGFFAVFALLIYAILNLAVFKLIPVTLTLAGMAGFILSVGIAVDANILIFERTKEELRRGREYKKAVSEGFKRAWTAIRDSNVSTLITVFILGYFGTSLIRGFAITLGIGILLSMFTALTVTRTFIHLAMQRKEKENSD